MIPASYICYLFGGLCAIAIILLALMLWGWCSAEIIETSEEEQRQSGRDC